MDAGWAGAASRPDASVQLSLQDATVRLGGRTVLDSISLQIRAGERVGIVGANGSGKTTLLRLLHGLIAAQPVQRAAPVRGSLRCAMVFQRPFLLSFSAARNVTLGLWLAGVPAAERLQRVEAALERVGLGAQAKRPARTLSGGQQQRLAFARALALQPDVLLLDEPTSSLDPSAKREVESLIESVSAQGVTLVLTSHNLGQVKRLASRVLYLDAGRLVVDLPTVRFFNDPLPPDAAQFLKGELPWP